MKSRTPEPHRTRIAVFGSVSAAQFPHRETAPASGVEPSVGAVLEAVFESISRRAAAIAAPVLDRAVADRRITPTERRKLLRELTHPRQGDAAAARVSETARSVLREALGAIRLAAPAIARPILAEAVISGRLSPTQQERILDRLARSPASALVRADAGATEGVS